ncbi:MAG TPA: hypothetical protein VMH82_03350 [Myxococcota bacterium]|nr:hypothetical protein [Myxococcota bacterium]
MRIALGLAIALPLALTAAPAATSGVVPDSPYLEPIPDPGPCDLVMNENNAPSALPLLNDPSTRVFCVDPGDYRSAGQLFLSASGTQASRRYLRFNATDSLKAVQRTQQAVFEMLIVKGSWWVVQGLTIQPQAPSTYYFVYVEGGDHDVFDGNLIDGIDHVNTQLGEAGVYLGSFSSDPATYNSVQANVVRNGNASHRPVDYTGIAVSDVGANNDYNKVLDNEVYDWGDAIALTSSRGDCNFPTLPHGTVIDGNEMYITGAKRIDCMTGAPDPNGDCACAENGVDLKPDPGASAWTQVTNNRLWGFRPTQAVDTCGGTGSLGQAITAGNTCPGHVLVANNIVLDSTVGIQPSGSSWIIAGNLFYDLRTPMADREVLSQAIDTTSTATNLSIEFNTIVDVDNAYDDMSSNTDTRCNAVIDSLAVNGNGGARGTNHVTAYDFLYDTPANNFIGATNESFATDAQSQDTSYCFWRKRWTAPEQVCVPFGTTTAASPHAQAAVNCHPDLAASLGMPTIGYPAPEPAGAPLAGATLLALAARARRSSGSRA